MPRQVEHWEIGGSEASLNGEERNGVLGSYLALLIRNVTQQ